MALKFSAKRELQRFWKCVDKNPEYSVKEVEDVYYEILNFYDNLSETLWKRFCTPKTEHSWYISSMIHESGSFANIVVNNIENFPFYRAKDARVAEEIKKKMYHNMYMFCLMIESLENFQELYKEK
jgi:hypothetical protein